MACLPEHNFNLTIGDTYTARFYVEDADGDKLDLDLYDIVMTVYEDGTSFKVYDAMTVTADVLTIKIPPADSALYDTANTYTYTLVLTESADATNVETYLKGEITAISAAAGD